MIVIGDASLTKQIRELWRANYIDPTGKYIDFFFKSIYKPEYSYCLVEDGQVKAVVLRIPQAVMFNDRILAASLLTGAAELADGMISEELLPVVLDACEHSELITLADVSDTRYFGNAGFERIYKKTRYSLERKNFSAITNFGCAYDPSPIDMLKVYSAFAHRFNGFSARNVEDFAAMKKEVSRRGGKTVAFYDEKNRIRAYACIAVKDDLAEIEECIYVDAKGLMKMVNAAFQERRNVDLVVSEAENLTVLLPGAVKKKEWSKLVRLNDASLFSRLFNTEVSTAQEAYAISRKPLYFNDRF